MSQHLSIHIDEAGTIRGFIDGTPTPVLTALELLANPSTGTTLPVLKLTVPIFDKESAKKAASFKKSMEKFPWAQVTLEDLRPTEPAAP